MSNYNDFLKVVAGLSSGTVFEITADWCAAHGLHVDSNIVKSWGHYFADDYSKYNCVYNGTGTDNHRSYKKL